MGLFAPSFKNLRELYINELRDLYSAETQIIEALPKMAEAATAPELKSAFNTHLRESLGHKQRLEQILETLGEKPTGETCQAMKGLVKEGEEYVKAGGDEHVRDAALIGAAQRVEHYEMAGYGTACSLAQKLGETGAATLLQQTLDEEGETNKKLTAIADGVVNPAAALA